VNGLLLRATARHLLHHPWQLGLALLGIALGVAVVCAVQLTQASARQALEYAQRSLLGPATHRIEAADGTLAEADFVTLAHRWPALPLAPVVTGEVTGEVTSGGAPAPRLQIVGIDPLAELADGVARQRLGGDLDLVRLLVEPGASWINVDTARRLGLARGHRLEVRRGERVSTLRIAGIAPAARDGGPADDMLVMDIASAQEVLGTAGSLSVIDVALPATGGAALAAGLRASLPAGWRLEATRTRLAATREMTRAFDVNLTALSLLALLVGMFLIYNTASFLMLQRQALFARLRALGVTRRELLVTLLAEAALLGVAGALAGLAFGRGIAGSLLAQVARTVNDLYYRAAITEIAVAPWLLAALVGVGVAATLLAALPPILAVTRSDVVDAVRPPAGARAGGTGVLPLLAGACFSCGALLLLWPSRALLPGFGALFACLLGAALLVPWLLDALTARAGRVRLSLPSLLGLRMLGACGQRTGLAAAALMAACATGIAITVMIASFRISVTDWLAALLRADVYVSLASEGRADGDSLATLRQRIGALPEVAATSAVARTRLHTPEGRVDVLAYDLPAAALPGFSFLAGDPDEVWAAWDNSDSVILTEAFAWRRSLGPGATLRIDTPRGQVSFRVAGIYRDYASERGSVAMSRATFLRHFAARDDDGLGVYAAPGVPAAALEQALRRALGGNRAVKLQSNASLRELSLAIFDQTFRVTDLLRVLALGVAFVGIVSALLAQQIERLSDYALMRALGLSRLEIGYTVLLQTLVAGLVAATIALPVGLVLAVLLIDVINVRSFGWTMDLHLPWTLLAGAWASAVLAACLAAPGPAWMATRQPPASVLRND
jgi:putative ABC transport system permease protein